MPFNDATYKLIRLERLCGWRSTWTAPEEGWPGRMQAYRHQPGRARPGQTVMAISFTDWRCQLLAKTLPISQCVIWRQSEKVIDLDWAAIQALQAYSPKIRGTLIGCSKGVCRNFGRLASWPNSSSCHLFQPKKIRQRGAEGEMSIRLIDFGFGHTETYLTSGFAAAKHGQMQSTDRQKNSTV